MKKRIIVAMLSLLMASSVNLWTSTKSVQAIQTNPVISSANNVTGGGDTITQTPEEKAKDLEKSKLAEEYIKEKNRRVNNSSRAIGFTKINSDSSNRIYISDSNTAVVQRTYDTGIMSFSISTKARGIVW